MLRFYERVRIYVLTKYNMGWVNKCDHTRSPDVFNWPIPKCPLCNR